MIEFFAICVVAGLFAAFIGRLAWQRKWLPALLLIFPIAFVLTLAGDDLAYGFATLLLACGVTSFGIGTALALIKRRESL